jgi:aarF domain-containing kinase
MNPEGNVLTFAKSMREQLDMTVEARNLLVFKRNFKDIPMIKFPSPIYKMCHPMVLVETFEHGIPIEDFIAPGKKNLYSQELKNQLASFGVVLYLKMIIDNFLHG